MSYEDWLTSLEKFKQETKANTFTGPDGMIIKPGNGHLKSIEIKSELGKIEVSKEQSIFIIQSLRIIYEL